MLHELRLFFVALQFMTRVPVPAWVGWRPELMHASSRYYPAVGLVVGGFGAAVLWFAAPLWPAPVAVGLSMAATVWMTGAFHEDGLADTFDALGGAVSREKALTIMKDSRIGSYGACGLVAVLGLKAAALHGLATRDFLATLAILPLAHAWSRAVPVLMLRLLSYAGDLEHAKSKPLAQKASAGTLFVVVAWCAAAGAAAVLWRLDLAHTTLAALVVGAVTLWMARWLARRLGGYTGDTLGAAQQFAELGVYLTFLAGMQHG
ncbi:MAG: adenosylcobinamide-GDP ribazoletransferase [Rubrivivax sp.]